MRQWLRNLWRRLHGQCINCRVKLGRGIPDTSKVVWRPWKRIKYLNAQLDGAFNCADSWLGAHLTSERKAERYKRKIKQLRMLLKE